MGRSRILLLLVVIASLCVVSPATAALVTLDANLDGLQVVPPNASPAFGELNATIDNVSGAFTVTSGSYQDLLGNSFAVTVNNAAAGVNGPILFALTLDSPGATTGTYSGSGTLTGLQVTDLLAGNEYVQIRSNVFPSGEIRGQIFATPEPSSFVLAGLAAIGLLALARRRRAA
jgi:hypothetical protein